MNISGIMNDLEAVSTKLSNISSDVANMVMINGSLNATRDMNDKLHEIRNEIASASRVIEENKQIIQNCCDALGINVYFSSSGGSSGSSRTGGSGGANASYVCLK